MRTPGPASPLVQSQEGDAIDSVLVEVPAIEFTDEGNPQSDSGSEP